MSIKLVTSRFGREGQFCFAMGRQSLRMLKIVYRQRALEVDGRSYYVWPKHLNMGALLYFKNISKFKEAG